MQKCDEIIRYVCDALNQIIINLESEMSQNDEFLPNQEELQSVSIIDASTEANQSEMILKCIKESTDAEDSLTPECSCEEIPIIQQGIESEVLRTRLINLVKNGKGNLVRLILRNIGVNRFTDIPESQYADVINMIENGGNNYAG